MTEQAMQSEGRSFEAVLRLRQIIVLRAEPNPPLTSSPKLSIVEEEADETAFWLDLIVESGICSHPSMPALRKEVEELLSIIVKSIQTLKLRKPK